MGGGRGDGGKKERAGARSLEDFGGIGVRHARAAWVRERVRKEGKVRGTRLRQALLGVPSAAAAARAWPGERGKRGGRTTQLTVAASVRPPSFLPSFSSSCFQWRWQPPLLGFLLLGAAEEGGREGGREKPLSSLPPSALRLSSSLLPPVNAVHSRGGEVVATGEGGRGRPLLEKQGAGAYARVRGGLEERASERTPSLSYSLSLSLSLAVAAAEGEHDLRSSGGVRRHPLVSRSVGGSVAVGRWVVDSSVVSQSVVQ